MGIASRTAQYLSLRAQPMWSLLASDNGPITIALLEGQFSDEARSIPAALFFERINGDLEQLRAAGNNLPRTAQAYAASWLADGYLVRRFPEGSREEVYELSAAAAEAMRYAQGLVAPRSTATESRLAVVIEQLVRLAEETELDPTLRIASLQEERARIDREIEDVAAGRHRTLPAERAQERVQEIITLAEGLTGDFRRVRDEFEGLNRSLRERIMDFEGSRGDVLESLFDGVDVIAESDAGRTFYAFWRLLTDASQNAALDESLEKVLSREFARNLAYEERRFLRRLTQTLLEEGGGVHEVLQQFARSLRQFVQSREYLEQRRINQLLRRAQRVAMEVKEAANATRRLDYALPLSNSAIASLAQWTLFDPTECLVEGEMEEGAETCIDLETIGQLVVDSEIDFRRLRLNIAELLQAQSQVSIGELVHVYPPHQGLGSIIGYLALASRHAIRDTSEERIHWCGADGEVRAARIPVYYFLKERLGELV